MLGDSYDVGEVIVVKVILGVFDKGYSRDRTDTFNSVERKMGYGIETMLFAEKKPSVVVFLEEIGMEDHFLYRAALETLVGYVEYAFVADSGEECGEIFLAAEIAAFVKADNPLDVNVDVEGKIEALDKGVHPFHLRCSFKTGKYCHALRQLGKFVVVERKFIDGGFRVFVGICDVSADLLVNYINVGIGTCDKVHILPDGIQG